MWEALKVLFRGEVTARQEHIQAARDEAEIAAACWFLKLQHRERDLRAAKETKNV